MFGRENYVIWGASSMGGEARCIKLRPYGDFFLCCRGTDVGSFPREQAFDPATFNVSGGWVVGDVIWHKVHSSV